MQKVVLAVTQLEKARSGIVTPEVREAAAKEGLPAEEMAARVARGTVVVLRNGMRNSEPVAVGEGLTVKVSASVGTAGEWADPDEEVAKALAAVEAGTDTVMDLSIADMDRTRYRILKAVSRPVGTLPLYQALAEARERSGSTVKMDVEDLFAVIEKQAADGVDFMAFHCATNRQTVESARKIGRTDYLVSYGGSHLVGWMVYRQLENPLYEQYDRLLAICKKYDVTLSLADGWRPGCLADSLDAAQVQEMVILGELVQRARAQGVQVMVKGPGHVPLQDIKSTITLQKSLCAGAPYFVFGPLVTDIAPGYDHVNAAIGGAVSAWAGADFLCCVTAVEHLRLPDRQEVREGVIAARIAAHAADLTRKPGAWQWDYDMSCARKALDWEKQLTLAIDRKRARQVRQARSANSGDTCAMCGQFCAMKVVAQYLGTEAGTC
ncbi:MAG: phosphomethylpyrimidine synthase ThiC [Peptococcaceae bacterium]|jgi:phosphomethylpyrimidine synthase|nr:phosphomethylpyrimidine synthase ThiC [Peptococcaceae bacterium]